jgi:hypothetical protein
MADELAAAGTIAEERVANIRAVRALGNDALEVARWVLVCGLGRGTCFLFGNI